jgi:hypothetical protein
MRLENWAGGVIASNPLQSHDEGRSWNVASAIRTLKEKERKEAIARK